MNFDVNPPAPRIRRLGITLSNDRWSLLGATQGEHPVDITTSLDEAFAAEFGLSLPDLHLQTLQVSMTRGGQERRVLVPLP